MAPLVALPRVDRSPLAEVVDDLRLVQPTQEMGESYFQVEGHERNAPIGLKAGQRYELVLVHVGMMEHEVLIGRDVIVEDGIPDGHEVNPLDALEVDVVGEGLPPGRARALRLRSHRGGCAFALAWGLAFTRGLALAGGFA